MAPQDVPTKPGSQFISERPVPPVMWSPHHWAPGWALLSGTQLSLHTGLERCHHDASYRKQEKARALYFLPLAYFQEAQLIQASPLLF